MDDGIAPWRRPVDDAVIPSFAELQQVDGRFFRRGITGAYRDELPEDLHQAFWSQASASAWKRHDHVPGVRHMFPSARRPAHLGDLVAEARHSHRPVTISEHGQPVTALISIDDLADLQDRAALAAHLADMAAGRGGTSLSDLDAARQDRRR